MHPPGASGPLGRWSKGLSEGGQPPKRGTLCLGYSQLHTPMEPQVTPP